MKSNEIVNEEEYMRNGFVYRFGSLEDFEEVKNQYNKLVDFNINENVFDTQGYIINEKVHFYMRWLTGYHITKAFNSMKVNLSDPNTTMNLPEGNIGTPQRISKMWCGSSLNDDNELLCGRWSRPPRLASFPNNDINNKHIPITKRVDLIAVCSHHAAPFSSTFREDGKAIVSYIPKNKVLGISKLQKIVNWVSKRGWLQEDLTKAIYDAVSNAAETKDVYVGLLNIEHSCESIRGANSKNGSFSSEYYGGKFNKNKLRKSIKS